MGRTIPSFRIAAEMERTRWKPFRSLLDKNDRKTFDRMISYSGLYNSACMMAVRPVVVHAMLVSVLFENYRQLVKMGAKTEWED